MPTLTKLAALVLFGLMAFYLAHEYQMLEPDVPESQSANMFFSSIAALVGWVFVGRRIDRSFIRGLTIVLQGCVATLFFSLALSGLYDIFAKGYRMRYKTFGDALDGSMTHAASVLQQMMDRDFLTLMLGGAVVVSIVLVMIFRVAEAKRFAQ